MAFAAFLSYRSETGSPYARALFEGLSRRLRDHRSDEAESDAVIYFDKEQSFPPGEAYERAIVNAIKQCGVVLAVIDPDWLGVDSLQSRKRRIDSVEDWVRREIGLALQLNKRLIPICVAGAQVPRRGDLPPDIRRLCDLQAITLVDDKYWELRLREIAVTVREAIKKGIRPADFAGVVHHLDEEARIPSASLLSVQEAMQHENQVFNTVSEVLRQRHDIVRKTIANVR